MKRLALTMLTVILLLCMLTSCIVIPLRKRYSIPADTVSSVQIYDLRQDSDRYDVFWEKDVPMYEVAPEEKAAFLSDLSKIRFKDTIVITIAAVDPSFSYGEWVARINYTDGTYEFLSDAGYGAKFDQTGEMIDSHHYGADDEEWAALISKYVPAEVFQASPSAAA